MASKMAAKEDLLFLFLYINISEICMSEMCLNWIECSFLIYNMEL